MKISLRMSTVSKFESEVVIIVLQNLNPPSDRELLVSIPCKCVQNIIHSAIR